MKNELFNELVDSLQEAKAINKGVKSASRSFSYSPLDIKAIREKLHYSQSEFAMMIGVSTSTLQNWEQGRRQPTGTAQALLRLVDKAPNLVRKTLKV